MKTKVTLFDEIGEKYQPEEYNIQIFVVKGDVEIELSVSIYCLAYLLDLPEFSTDQNTATYWIKVPK